MKSISTRRMMLAAIMMVAGAVNLMADVGDEMTVKTQEGVQMKFYVTNESEKKCAVYGRSNPNVACIDHSVTGTVTIPETVLGYTVTYINAHAFDGCSVSYVVIPQTVTGTGDYVFNGCESLLGCQLPEKIKTVNKGLFRDCKSLVSVYIPHQVTKIDEMAFLGCLSLSEIVIPASVTSIGDYAFWDCKSLGLLAFLGELPTIGSNVFSGASTEARDYFLEYSTYGDPMIDIFIGRSNGTSYYESLRAMFSSDVIVIVNYRLHCKYQDGSNMKNIRVRDRSTMGYMVGIYITGYDESTEEYECSYDGADELLEDKTFTVPEKILDYKVVGLSHIGNMPNLESAVIPGTCKSIGERAFFNRSSLKTVDIEEGLESVAPNSFANTRLMELRLPKSLKTYGLSAVSGCSRLTDVYLPVYKVKVDCEGYYEFDMINYYVSYSNSQATLHVPFGASGNYVKGEKDGWILDWANEFANVVEMDPQDGDIFPYPYKTDNDMMFQVVSAQDKTCRVYGDGNYEDALNATPCIPKGTEGVVSIPSKARDLTVMEIDTLAFMGCEKITLVNIPNTVKKIGAGAFGMCSSLVSVEIPALVERIEDSAFAMCTDLNSVTLHEGLLSIEQSAFGKCSSLVNISLPGSLTEIGNNALSETAITSIDIPGGVKTISTLCFDECTALETVNIGEGVQDIDSYAFFRCSALKSIDLPKSVEKLGAYAFNRCENLADVKIRHTHIQLLDAKGDPTEDDNHAFDSKQTRYAELSVPKDTYEHYNCDPWFQWFKKIKYDLPNIPTGVENANQYTTTDSQAVYDLQGRKQNDMRKGVNIVRMGDGSTRKVVGK